MPDEYWAGTREFIVPTVQDNSVTVTADYQLAMVKFPDGYLEADWHNTLTYDNQRGLWLEPTVGAGLYRIWARVGQGAPNERPIIYCGHLVVRSR